MTKKERQQFIRELTNNVKEDLLKECGKYPTDWDGFELRWRVADVYGQVVFGENGKRKGKRYLDYKNTVLIKNLI
jgi:hypothetical protein